MAGRRGHDDRSSRGRRSARPLGSHQADRRPGRGDRLVL